ncbi:N-acetylmuramoyl-L-alanine amidase [Streptomyces sp. NPDC088755]|uniref:N-acetylmuramoyl-L-alanine amidase n=1 Tax=Streptomyces sp. NPDC088755 TaxID=3365888 RepID=UPI00382BF283
MRRSSSVSAPVGAVAVTALLLPLLGTSPSAATPSSDRLQRAFAAAAAEYHVPQSVLLGVSYLQSRWDAHGGAPSVVGGYGPMHLTDARTHLARASERPEVAEDLRGDDLRPRRPDIRLPRSEDPPARLMTLPRAAELTGLTGRRLRTDPAANVAGGAALLAAAQRGLGRPASGDPADWYQAVARFSGTDDPAASSAYADDVYAVIRDGKARTTDAGQRVTLTARPDVTPGTAGLTRTGRKGTPSEGPAECPRTVSCEWVPAPYEQLGDGRFGNHDLSARPASQPIRYIVVHDIEGTWEAALGWVRNPASGASWNYTVRSTDGRIAQHVKAKDVAWHAGNWYVNTGSIGLEHEGFLTEPDAWFTEAMYRSSARLVRYLAKKYDIPLDRQHILGHDNVPGTTPVTIPGMHTDPGPYWDWAHYFRLLGRPFEATAGRDAGLVTIRPDYAANRPLFTGCQAPGVPCAPHGSGAVRLYSDHDVNAPLISDPGLGTAPTTGVNDLSSRVSTGQQYAVAGRWRDWTAIWYLGQKAWFRNPAERPTAVGASGRTVTPRPGLWSVPVYGRAYPEASAYPADVPVQPLAPLPYTLTEGQQYVAGDRVRSAYFYAVTFDPAGQRTVVGRDQYYEIQYGHRVAFVRAADVRVVRSGR